MDKKELIRRKFKLKRKKNYYMINSNFFSPLKKIIFNKKKKINFTFPFTSQLHMK